jgi:quercetin dioxygenase-like cupin family protein
MEEMFMAEVGTKLIFENDRVRVWEFTLRPGESIEAHKHDNDYFFYPIEGATLDVIRASGTTQLTLKTGEVYFRKGGDTHAARNSDDHRYHELLVELKA